MMQIGKASRPFSRRFSLFLVDLNTSFHFRHGHVLLVHPYITYLSPFSGIFDPTAPLLWKQKLSFPDPLPPNVSITSLFCKKYAKMSQGPPNPGFRSVKVEN